MEITLEGKRAFITAGGGGMGRATALAMHALGAQVFTCDIDESSLESLPAGITSWPCNVADSTAVDALFDEILRGGLDFMINNAGIAGPTKPVEDVTDDEWRQCMAVGIDATFFCTRRVAPLFKQQGNGVIINMISTAGVLAFPMRSPYAAAKWAVTGFTKTMAMELGPHNIRVNGIAPGNVTGDRMDRVVAAQARHDDVDREAIREMYSRSTSMQCWVDPEEVADLIVYLCSDHGRHISGQIIGVDGNTETLYPRT